MTRNKECLGETVLPHISATIPFPACSPDPARSLALRTNPEHIRGHRQVPPSTQISPKSPKIDTYTNTYYLLNLCYECFANYSWRGTRRPGVWRKYSVTASGCMVGPDGGCCSSYASRAGLEGLDLDGSHHALRSHQRHQQSIHIQTQKKL